MIIIIVINSSPSSSPPRAQVRLAAQHPVVQVQPVRLVRPRHHHQSSSYLLLSLLLILYDTIITDIIIILSNTNINIFVLCPSTASSPGAPRVVVRFGCYPRLCSSAWASLHSKRPHFPKVPGHIFCPIRQTSYFCSNPISVDPICT